LWQSEQSIWFRFERDDLYNGIRFERTIQVREEFAFAGVGRLGFGGRLPFEFGRQSGWVDDQQNESSLAAVKGVGNTHDLGDCRAVDKALRGKTVRGILAIFRSGKPGCLGCEMKNEGVGFHVLQAFISR